jgi:hypothetical protein
MTNQRCTYTPCYKLAYFLECTTQDATRTQLPAHTTAMDGQPSPAARQHGSFWGDAAGPRNSAGQGCACRRAAAAKGTHMPGRSHMSRCRGVASAHTAAAAGYSRSPPARAAATMGRPNSPTLLQIERHSPSHKSCVGVRVSTRLQATSNVNGCVHFSAETQGMLQDRRPVDRQPKQALDTQRTQRADMWLGASATAAGSHAAQKGHRNAATLEHRLVTRLKSTANYETSQHMQPFSD